MNSSDFRAKAREKLAGKWGKAACITLVYLIISFILSFVDNKIDDNTIFSILITLIEIPLGYGFIFSCLKLYKNEEVEVFNFLSLGFKNFGRAWKIQLWTIVKLIVPIIILFAGIWFFKLFIKIGTLSSDIYFLLLFSLVGALCFILCLFFYLTQYYNYILSQLISIVEPDLTAKNCVEKSRELMDGKRFKLFCLSLSFIGWAFLGILSFGIGLLWIIPYMNLAQIAFYFYVSGNEENNAIPEENDLNTPIQ